MDNGSETFFRSNSDYFTFHDHALFIKGNKHRSLHNPTVGTSIMLEFLAKSLLGNMPLVPTNKLFKSSLGLFFECCGIARDVPIIINETEVHLDFHIYAILDFDLLIGYPSEMLFLKILLMGALMKSLGRLLLPLTLISPRWSVDGS
jgi:hypothetical protein